MFEVQVHSLKLAELVSQRVPVAGELEHEVNEGNDCVWTLRILLQKANVALDEEIQHFLAVFVLTVDLLMHSKHG